MFETFRPSACEIVLCNVGAHLPDNTFTGWYFRTDAFSSAGRPIWIKVGNGVTISYSGAWVIKHIFIKIECEVTDES